MSYIVGQCTQMCPVKEIDLRERERLLHPLEILPGTEKQKFPKADPKRIIKCFSRSAAGIDLTDPKILRPAPTLYKTVEYIIKCVINDERFSYITIYDFVVDRFRAISQDMTIQRLPPQDYVKIYEPIVKFYVLFGYILCEEKISLFDPVLHRKHFMEYLKHLLVCYDEIEKSNHMLIDSMKELKIGNSNYTVSDSKSLKTENIMNNSNNRSLIEAIYILSSIGNTDVLLRYLNLPSNIKTLLLNTAFQISLDFMKGNFIRVCKFSPKLHYLAQCIAYLQLPIIRKITLKIFNTAFHSKNLAYPAKNLLSILLYNNFNELQEDCQLYNVKLSNDNIFFDKNNFNDKNTAKPRKCEILSANLKNSVISSMLLET